MAVRLNFFRKVPFWSESPGDDPNPLRGRVTVGLLDPLNSLTAQRIDSEREKLISQFDQLEKLHTWANDPSNENRLKAKREILRCYIYRDEKLALDGMELRNLPDVFGLLPHLKYLSLKGNLLIQLPKSMALLSLKYLNGASTQKLNTYIEQSEGYLLFQQSVRFSFYSLQVQLDNWVEDSPHYLEKRSEVRDQILNCFLEKRTKLSFKNKFLRSLPDVFNFLCDVKDLDFSGNCLTQLPKSMQALSSLACLNLYDNKFSRLPDWMGTLRLKQLDLRLNPLSELPKSVGSLALERLNGENILDVCAFYRKKGAVIQATRFSFYSLIVKLDAWILNSGNVDEIYSVLKRRSDAKKKILRCYIGHEEGLSFDGMRLRSLPDIFHFFNQLKSLSLIANQLSVLPKSVKTLSNLLFLNLSDNKFDRLPEPIKGLPLIEVDFSYNPLDVLPEWIGDFPLKELNLNKTGVSQLPESIGNFSQLEELYINKTRLTHFPESIGKLSNLKVLCASDNRLRQVPVSIGQLCQLKSLVLERNRLTYLPPSFFNLRDVYCELSFNHFSESSIRDIQRRVAGKRDFDIELSVHQENTVQIDDFYSCVVQLQEDADQKVDEEMGFFLEQDQQNLFLVFYQDLQKSLSYKGLNQKITAQFLLDCLKLAKKQKEFKNVFLGILQEASSYCGDRVSLNINEMYFQYYLYTQFQDVSLAVDREIARFLIGFHRINLLKEEAIAFIKDYKGVIDHISAHLYLQVILKDQLSLPLFPGVDNLLYPQFSGLTSQKIQEIANRVQRKTANQIACLTALEIWRKYLETKYSEEYLSINDRYELLNSASEETDEESQKKIETTVRLREFAVDLFYTQKAQKALA